MHGTIATALNTLTPSGVAEAIRAVRGTGISLYNHGGPGLSKSAVAQQVATQENIAFIDFRLSQVAPEDVRGVPMPGEIDGMKGVIWQPPLVFPRDLDYQGVERVEKAPKTIRFFNPKASNGVHYCTAPEITVTSFHADLEAVVVVSGADHFSVTLVDQNGNAGDGLIKWRVTGKVAAILALEEFNSAPPSVMAAAYQLVLDRRLGDYLVPEGVMILALGNRDIDRGVTYQLAKPVANRFIHIETVFDWQDWFTWAGNNNIHPDVLGYLSKWPSKTYVFDADSPFHSFPTPRSWEFVSRIISQPNLPSDATLRALIAGAIGDAVGAEFVQHRKFMADMPDVDDILNGVITEFKPSNSRFEMQIAYSLCVQLCYALKSRSDVIQRDYHGKMDDYNKHPPRREWLEQADRAFGYIIDNFRPDVTIMAARLAAVVCRLDFSPARMPRFKALLSEYNKAIMA